MASAPASRSMWAQQATSEALGSHATGYVAVGDGPSYDDDGDNDDDDDGSEAPSSPLVSSAGAGSYVSGASSRASTGRNAISYDAATLNKAVAGDSLLDNSATDVLYGADWMRHNRPARRRRMEMRPNLPKAAAAADGGAAIAADDSADFEDWRNRSMSPSFGEPEDPIPWGDLINVFKAFVGSNYMSMAFALRMAGMGFGIPGTLIVAWVTAYCCLALVHCKYVAIHRYSSKHVHTYGDVADAAFGSVGRLVIDCALVFTQFAFCVGYMIFVGQNLHSVVPSLSVDVITLFAAGLLALLALLRNMRALIPFSMLANVALLVGFVMVLRVDIIDLSDKGFAPDSESDLFRVSTVPMFFGIVVSGFEGIGLVLPVEASIKRGRRHFGKLLVVVLVSVTGILTVFGILGFGNFGAGTCSIILMNLDPTSSVVLAVKAAVVVGIVFTFPMQVVPIVEVVEQRLLRRLRPRDVPDHEDDDPDIAAAVAAATIRESFAEGSRGSAVLAGGSSGGPAISDLGNAFEGLGPRAMSTDSEGGEGGAADDGTGGVASLAEAAVLRFSWARRRSFYMAQNVVRVSIVAATAIVAIKVPEFGMIGSLAGALGGAILAFIMPMAMRLKLLRKSLRGYQVVMCYAIMLFGICGGVIGTTVTIEEIVKRWKSCPQM